MSAVSIFELKQPEDKLRSCYYYTEQKTKLENKMDCPSTAHLVIKLYAHENVNNYKNGAMLFRALLPWGPQAVNNGRCGRTLARYARRCPAWHLAYHGLALRQRQASRRLVLSESIANYP